MHDRCYNPHYHRYNAYGGKGIRVCFRWRNTNPYSFRNFLTDMGEHPGKGYSLGRFDTNWIYSPANTYWATVRQQANNQRRPLPSTGLRGVRRTAQGKYRAVFYHNGKECHLGMFTTPDAAAAAYQTAMSAGIAVH